jgi:hypothetical protein
VAISTVTPGRIKTGPGLYRYAPLGTALPTVAAIASSFAAVSWAAGWIDIGATDDGLTYTEAVQSAPVPVAETVYPIKTVVSSKVGTVALAAAQLDDLNWKLAMNGGTITVSGTAGTKMSLYIPPLAGAETRVMVAFQSLADDEILIFGQCFQTGSIAVSRKGVGDVTKALLPMEFTAELPADTANWTTPYKRYVTSALQTSP